MAVTGKQYAAKVLEVYHLKPKAGYILGTRGKLWTAKDQEKLNKTTDEKYKYGRLYGKKWIGHRVWDCSGLTYDSGLQLGLKYHHGSNSSWRYDCEKKGELTSGMELPEGAWVYTGNSGDKPHIGTYTGDGKVTEASGTNAGVIQTKLHGGKWKYWGLGKGIDFDFIPGEKVAEKEPSLPVNTTKPSTTISYPTLRKGSKGELVTQLQDLLSKDGGDLKIDGIFGPITLSEVKAFQKRHGLVVDGIVGPKTWAELIKIK